MSRVFLIIALVMFVIAFIVSLGVSLVMAAFSWAMLGFICWIGALLS